MLARFHNCDAAGSGQIKLEVGGELTKGEPEDVLQHGADLAAVAGQCLGKTRRIK